MKKTISFFLAFLFIFLSAPSIFAEHNIALNGQSTTEIIYLDNGGYITITLVVDDLPSLSRSSSKSASYTRFGEKSVASNDASGNLEWEYTLFGEFFVVEGVSAVCTNASYSENIYKSGWSFSDGDATQSGNTAYGVGTFKKKVLFITVDTVNIDVQLSCDINGNLS